jgi:hypothetical protein
MEKNEKATANQAELLYAPYMIHSVTGNVPRNRAGTVRVAVGYRESTRRAGSSAPKYIRHAYGEGLTIFAHTLQFLVCWQAHVRGGVE